MFSVTGTVRALLPAVGAATLIAPVYVPTARPLVLTVTEMALLVVPDWVGTCSQALPAGELTLEVTV